MRRFMCFRKGRLLALASVVAAAIAATVALMAAPSVFPTGTTVYRPDKAWNGYTVLSALNSGAAIVIDMNGNVVKQWDGFTVSAGGPARILPNGVVIAPEGANGGRQESMALVERDFNGKELWRWDHTEEVEGSNGEKVWAARQHHDWQRTDFPAGYYAPGAAPAPLGANTLILAKRTHVVPAVNPVATLEDDRLLEVSPDGKILWDWLISDHVDEFKFTPEARNAISTMRGANGPAAAKGGAKGKGKGGGAPRGFDWMHINAAAYLGPNHWYDEGDRRFAPENVIISSREASLIAIVARDGHVVWQLGPDFNATPEMRAIGQIIGQHNTHFIPKGLPGAGNLMVFDNGGGSGYGPPSPNAPTGRGVYLRASSRVLEIDPVNLKLVWSYTAGTGFYGTNISGAQRLENGNTLITEGPTGRLFEVTRDGAIVWEYVYAPAGGGSASVYRGNRLPYSWIPQLPRPTEKAVTPPEPAKFRVP